MSEFDLSSLHAPVMCADETLQRVVHPAIPCTTSDSVGQPNGQATVWPKQMSGVHGHVVTHYTHLRGALYHYANTPLRSQEKSTFEFMSHRRDLLLHLSIAGEHRDLTPVDEDAIDETFGILNASQLPSAIVDGSLYRMVRSGTADAESGHCTAIALPISRELAKSLLPAYVAKLLWFFQNSMPPDYWSSWFQDASTAEELSEPPTYCGIQGTHLFRAKQIRPGLYKPPEFERIANRNSMELIGLLQSKGRPLIEITRDGASWDPPVPRAGIEELRHLRDSCHVEGKSRSSLWFLDGRFIVQLQETDKGMVSHRYSLTVEAAKEAAIILQGKMFDIRPSKAQTDSKWGRSLVSRCQIGAFSLFFAMTPFVGGDATWADSIAMASEIKSDVEEKRRRRSGKLESSSAKGAAVSSVSVADECAVRNEMLIKGIITNRIVRGGSWDSVTEVDTVKRSRQYALRGPRSASFVEPMGAASSKRQLGRPVDPRLEEFAKLLENMSSPQAKEIVRQLNQPGRSLAILFNCLLVDEVQLFAKGLNKAGYTLAQMVLALDGKQFQEFVDATSAKTPDMLEAFNRQLEKQYEMAVFGDKKPTVKRFNMWMRGLRAKDIAHDQKPKIANLVQHFRDVLKGDLMFAEEDDLTRCTITTEKPSPYTRIFTVRTADAERRDLYRRSPFPPLVLK